jgi:hypothetical protein
VFDLLGEENIVGWWLKSQANKTQAFGLRACSFGLSATSHQYFSLRINQPPATN